LRHEYKEGEKVMKKFLALVLALALFVPAAFAQEGSSFESLVLDIIKKNPGIIKEALQKFEEEVADKAQEDEFKNLLTDKVEVDVGKTPILGKKKAKYNLIAFSDFQCPFCKRGDDTVKALLEKYGDDMNYVFKNFPLSFHPEATPAAKACWAAGEQGKYYEYSDKLFENQGQLGEELYVKIAEELGLKIDKFNKARNSEKAEKAVKEDTEAGQAVGIRGTPGFILNGVKVFGAYPVEHFDKVISALEEEANTTAQK
jgi:protein-disulfide isomerase